MARVPPVVGTENSTIFDGRRIDSLRMNAMAVPIAALFVFSLGLGEAVS